MGGVYTVSCLTAHENWKSLKTEIETGNVFSPLLLQCSYVPMLLFSFGKTFSHVCVMLRIILLVLLLKPCVYSQNCLIALWLYSQMSFQYDLRTSKCTEMVICGYGSDKVEKFCNILYFLSVKAVFFMQCEMLKDVSS